MNRSTLTLIGAVVVISGAFWLFTRKRVDVERSDLASLIESTTPSPSEVSLPNGLRIQDTVVGSGAAAKPGDFLAVHYVGTLENGKKFDSSYDRGQPFEFILGGGMVIQGWDLGFEGMKVGGKRKLIIPPALGYGNRDLGVIPPNSTLVFEVELVAVKSQ